MDDGLTGAPILRGDGEWSAAWAKADARYWRQIERDDEDETETEEQQ